MKRPLIALYLTVVTAASLLMSGCGINNIPTYDEEVKAAWSQVQNQYKRRADLVPNLVETVKGYAKHEQDTLKAVIEARAQATSVQLTPEMLNNQQAFAQFQKGQDALSSALSRLMVVVERYPDLKANQNFLSLQSQLEGTENRIAVARRDYIESVKKYNTELRTIPGRWIAAIFYSDAQVKANFEQPESVQTAPAVKF